MILEQICSKILRSGENGRFGMNILCGRLEYNGETIRKDGSRTRISRIWRNNKKMEHWDSEYLLTMINWKVLNQYKVTYLIWLVMHLSQCQLFCNSTYVQSGEHFCQTQWLDTPTKTSMQTSSFNNRFKNKTKKICLLCEICLFSVSTRPPLHPRTFGTIKLFKLFTSWPPRQLKLSIASLSTLWSQRPQKEAGKERSEGSVKFSANGAQRYTIHIFKCPEWFWTIGVSQETLCW